MFFVGWGGNRVIEMNVYIYLYVHICMYTFIFTHVYHVYTCVYIYICTCKYYIVFFVLVIYMYNTYVKKHPGSPWPWCFGRCCFMNEPTCFKVRRCLSSSKRNPPFLQWWQGLPGYITRIKPPLAWISWRNCSFFGGGGRGRGWAFRANMKGRIITQYTQLCLKKCCFIPFEPLKISE